MGTLEGHFELTQYPLSASNISHGHQVLLPGSEKPEGYSRVGLILFHGKINRGVENGDHIPVK